MTHTDPVEAELLADILANPGDELPRRAYADWHLDYGNAARGEFVHLQLDIYAHSKAYYLSYKNCTSEERSAIAAHRRAAELLKDAWGWWLIDNGMGGLAYDWEFRRGFIESVTHEHGDWLGYAPRLLAAHPVRRATWRGKGPLHFAEDARHVWRRQRTSAAPWEVGEWVIPAVYFESMAAALGFVNPASPIELFYTSPDAALDALSEAMLAAARAAGDPKKSATPQRVMQ